MDNAQTWIKRAKSNLIRGKDSSYLDLKDINLEDLCFDLQQCAEKSLKAILIKNNIEFPKTHNISELLILIRQKTTIIIPEKIKEAAILTDYAVNTRYPSDFTPVSLEEHKETLEIAENVYNWAKNIIEAGK
ncbi:MAG TPA: DNA-binding protein [Cyanobacteria bacterium UBA9971]|nr:DNA-binding protein [Cyanobacteria bacterium UBA9971]